MRLGTVRARSGKTCAGVYQGSLLLSTPGQPHMPGSQAVRRCLIVYPDRVNAGGLAKGRPRRWHSRSVVISSNPIGAQRSGSDWERRSSGINELFPVGKSECYGACSDDVVACAVGRSSVQVVTRTAGMKLSRSTTVLAVLLL